MNLETSNPSEETIPCVRRSCPGVKPWTVHQPSLTANMCVVIELAHTTVEVDFLCDYCGQVVTPDVNGWWVGDDNTSDCRADQRGHEVDGRARA